MVQQATKKTSDSTSAKLHPNIFVVSQGDEDAKVQLKKFLLKEWGMKNVSIFTLGFR